MIGKQIGKGCNAAVYESAAPFAAPAVSRKCSLVELNQKETNDDNKKAGPLRFSATPSYPLAMKMMWNIGVIILSFLAFYFGVKEFFWILCRMRIRYSIPKSLNSFF